MEVSHTCTSQFWMWCFHFITNNTSMLTDYQTAAVELMTSWMVPCFPSSTRRRAEYLLLQRHFASRSLEMSCQSFDPTWQIHFPAHTCYKVLHNVPYCILQSTNSLFFLPCGGWGKNRIYDSQSGIMFTAQWVMQPTPALNQPCTLRSSKTAAI